MNVPPEGSRVAYTGDGDEGVTVGDTGKVLQSGATGSWVLWATGSRKGDPTLVHNIDLTVTRTMAHSNDSLDSGPLVTTATSRPALIRETAHEEAPRGHVVPIDRLSVRLAAGDGES